MTVLSGLSLKSKDAYKGRILKVGEIFACLNAHMKNLVKRRDGDNKRRVGDNK